MNWLAELATKRTPWLLLAVISLAFEITALFFNTIWVLSHASCVFINVQQY